MALDVQAQNLYSYNKDHIDDLPTSTLKYLMLPFLLAECLDAQKATREERRLNLLAAKAHYQIFDAEIKSLTRDDSSFKKLNKDFAAGPASTEDPGSRRHFVITRRQTLSILEAELEKTAKYAFRPEESDSAEARAFWIDLLKLSLLETRANLELIEEELRMLNHAENIQNQDRDEKIDLNERKQLSVFKISSPDDLKKFYMSNVFKPGHLLPTISLAEAADAEMQIDVHQLQRAQKTTVKEWNEEGDEAELTAQEEMEKVKKEREWDDWKDENPKGSASSSVERQNQDAYIVPAYRVTLASRLPYETTQAIPPGLIGDAPMTDTKESLGSVKDIVGGASGMVFNATCAVAAIIALAVGFIFGRKRELDREKRIATRRTSILEHMYETHGGGRSSSRRQKGRRRRGSSFLVSGYAFVPEDD